MIAFARMWDSMLMYQVKLCAPNEIELPDRIIEEAHRCSMTWKNSIGGVTGRGDLQSLLLSASISTNQS